MRKMSKTLLSMALVLAMVLSLVPMSFAEGGEEAAGIKIVYDIRSKLTSWSDTSLDFTTINYIATNGFWDYDSNSTGTDNIGTTFNMNPDLGLYMNGEGVWWAVKISVPKTATYTPSVSYTTHKNNNGFYVLIASTEKYDSPSDVIENAILRLTESGGDTVIAGNEYVETDGQKTKIAVFDAMTLDEGEYYLIYENATDSGWRIPGNFTLTAGDGSGNAIMGGSITATADEIALGDPSTVTATGYLSSTNVEAKFTYSTEDTDVVTVDAESGVVTTIGAGEATIVATCADAVEGCNTLEKKITVTEPPATEVTIVYDIRSKLTSWSDTSLNFTTIDYIATNGFWDYDSNSTGTDNIGTTFNMNPDLGLYMNGEGVWWAVKISVPKTATYTPSVSYTTHKTNNGFYVLIASTEKYDSPSDVIRNATLRLTESGGDTVIAGSEYVETDGQKTKIAVFDAMTLDEGEYYLIYENTTGSGWRIPGNFTLTAGNGDALMHSFNGNTTLEIGEKATLKGFLSSTATAATVTYGTSNDCVNVGTDGTITAVEPGKATVTMTASGSTVVDGVKTYSVDITVKDAKTDFVSVAIDDDGDGVATIQSAALGDSVTAIANVPSGKVFRGWVRGSADNGRLVSTEDEYKFTATTHIYLTAIYSDEPTVATNEYYHFNGEFLGTSEPTDDLTLVGYTFAKEWTNAGTDGLITRLIAKFNKKTDDYTVTNDGTFTMEMSDSKYDTEVICTSEAPVYWYRDGKLVDYGTEYKFFIWDATTVITTNEGHNGAKLMLDKNVKDSTYMVEYDAGNTTLLEVGILFGADGETPTVESCQEKMSSQRDINESGHGQFSAASGKYPVARGYLVYQDGENYRIIYAD